MAQKVSFPVVDVNGHKDVNDVTIACFYDHTEKETPGGYYPMGANTVWHGGVHIFTRPDEPVYACAPGTIVAARLPEAENVAKGYYGHRGFILIRHELRRLGPKDKNTLLVGHALQAELEKKYKAKGGYGSQYKYDGYHTETTIPPLEKFNKERVAKGKSKLLKVDKCDQYVCTGCGSEVLKRAGYGGLGPHNEGFDGDDMYKTINIWSLPHRYEGKITQVPSNDAVQADSLKGKILSTTCCTLEIVGGNAKPKSIGIESFDSATGTIRLKSPFKKGPAVNDRYAITDLLHSIKEEHAETKGVVHALTKMGNGREILRDPDKKTFAEPLQPGDFIQYWIGAMGHCVQVEEYFGDSLTIHGSHGGTAGIAVHPSRFTIGNFSHIYAVRPKANLYSKEYYYSLYMHLGHGTIDENGGYCEAEWLKEWIGKAGTSTVKGSTGMYWLPANPPKRIGGFDEGVQLNVVEDAAGGKFAKVTFKTNDPRVHFDRKPGGDQATAFVEKAQLKPFSDVAESADLKAGKVVQPNISVEAGEKIWEAGTYATPKMRILYGDDPDKLAPMIHWEIFSEDNLFPEWKAVQDSNDDFTMDCDEILKMVEQDPFGLNSVLTAEEIRDFYSSQVPKVKELRRYACQFVSEWAIKDVKAAMSRLKGLRFDCDKLAERIKPYLWWDEAPWLKTDFHVDRKVWHYNPIAFLEQVLKS